MENAIMRGQEEKLFNLYTFLIVSVCLTVLSTQTYTINLRSN